MKAIALTPELYNYVLSHADVPHAVLERVRRRTAELPNRGMQIGADQGEFMHLLAKLIGAKRVLEIGCFTGYSAIAVASALPANGQLISLDIDPTTSAMARDFFKEAGLDHIIDLRLGPALETLSSLTTEFGAASFDMVFIDADKENQWAYYEAALGLLRPNGVILADNVLWGGSVIDAADQESSTNAIRRFNDKVCCDPRVEKVLLNIADGIYMIRKK